MRTSTVLLLLLIVVGAPAAAQSFNVDLGQPGTAPPADYRAAGVPGAWNKMEATNSSIHYSLVGLDGQLTGVWMNQIGGTEIVVGTAVGPNAPHGPDALLLGDTLVTHTATENCLFFHNVVNGTYEITTYAWMPTSPTTQNSVHIDTNPQTQLVGGPWPGVHTAGVTFARHTIQVTNNFIGPHSGVPSGGNYGIGAALNGIQLRLLTTLPPLFTTPTRLSWLTALNATSYDVVVGDLGLLRSTGGDFTAATTGCGANNFAGTQLPYPGSEPDPGSGRWYLVRGVSGGNNYSYDEPGSTQVGLRDAEINAAPAACN